MTMPKIKPCPKCGETDLPIYKYEHGWQHVECDECQYLGPGAGSKIDAVKQHNEEYEASKEAYATPTPAPEIAALRAENERLRETTKMEWRLIETAPNDGASVLIWVDGHMIEASFDSDACQWIAGAWGLGFGKDATYWAPLPPTPLQTNGPAPERAALPQDVINLVIAAREAFDTGWLEDPESNALDKALEPFSSRVPYENEPDAVAPEQEEAAE